MAVYFFIVVALIGILMIKNARYCLRVYVFENRQLMLCLVYFTLLFSLGGILFHGATKLFGAVQVLEEPDPQNPLTPYTEQRLRKPR